MLILGIETSCDETAVALYSGAQGLIDHKVYSQLTLHAAYGGTVPELAARDHCQRLAPMVQSLLTENRLNNSDLSAIAYTAGPGLQGALLVGASFARSLAYSLAIPSIAVHHLEGHLVAPQLDNPERKPPFVALLVSGGHTLLIDVKQLGSYQIIGQSVDDAAGEAFDKTARLLGLSHPGGPAIAKAALQGVPERFTFTRPMVNRPGCDFSFSGLKTQAMQTWLNCPQNPQDVADIALAFEQAVVDTLFIKCKRALSQTGHNILVVAGGVSANQRLRQRLAGLAATVDFPGPDFCTDNAAMIALAGFYRLQAGYADAGLAIPTRARWPLSELSAIS